MAAALARLHCGMVGLDLETFWYPIPPARSAAYYLLLSPAYLHVQSSSVRHFVGFVLDLEKHQYTPHRYQSMSSGEGPCCEPQSTYCLTSSPTCTRFTQANPAM
ncbi:hypothetical protein DL546_006332 [Coniochaeta pulveracea]|uniref:Uncharacterized protein n=1 Tax=Coniochaeta pulveracea TaxID=177199 RepID=A0A420Y6L4_9PEZI|nr:hypothetical protein DL546_006332 [Coniochaeta pulveracea]